MTPGTPPSSTATGHVTPPEVFQQDIDQLAKLARAHAQKVLKKVPAMGPIVWLMMSQATTRHTLLGELEWRVLPPLVLDQAKLYYREDAPVAFASWARLSEAVAQRYRCSPHHLTAADWNSGEQLWLIDVFTPFGGAREVLKDLRENVFPGRAIHQLLPDGEAQAKVLTWPAA